MDIPVKFYTEVKGSTKNADGSSKYPHTPLANRFNWHELIHGMYGHSHDNKQLEDFCSKFMVCQKCKRSTRLYDAEVYDDCLVTIDNKKYLIE